MPVLADLTDALIALIPEDGSRITNDQIRAALEQEAGEPLSDAELKEIKTLVVAMGVAEAVKGPGGGLKAPGLDPPPRATAGGSTASRTRRSGNGASARAVQATIAPADGWSLDDKRYPLLPLEKLGPAPKDALA
jgi:hypothetical protein